MKKIIPLVCASLFAITLHAGDYLYKSPNKLDFIKIDRAKKEEKEGGLKHPATIDVEQMKGILSSIHFSKNLLIFKDIKEKNLFAERHTEFLASYLVDGLQKTTDQEVVVVSYFTKNSKFLIQNNRLTIFRAFVKEDGLHLHFNKIYAKILGDREAKGVQRAANDAVGINVVLEMQPGQSWVTVDPPEVLFDPHFDFVKGTSGVVEKEIVKKGKGKEVKEVEVKEVAAKEKPKPPSYDDAVEKMDVKSSAAHRASIKQRLKELEDLKKEDLITEKEYQKKRRDLLQEL